MDPDPDSSINKLKNLTKHESHSIVTFKLPRVLVHPTCSVKNDVNVPRVIYNL